MSFKDFSTSIAALTVAVKAFLTANIAPAEAPKAKTRAFEASKDFSNSPSCPFILPSGLKPLVLRARSIFILVVPAVAIPLTLQL